MSDSRQLAHELVDSLPDDQLAGLVSFLRTIVDPVAEALRDAPLDDEEETESEERAIHEARRWLEDHDGKGIPHAEAMSRLGLG